MSNSEGDKFMEGVGAQGATVGEKLEDLASGEYSARVEVKALGQQVAALTAERDGYRKALIELRYLVRRALEPSGKKKGSRGGVR